jgi:hypothetical protein
MPGVYGGLIIIIMYATEASVIVEQELFLITQGGDPILTNSGQNILVEE